MVRYEIIEELQKSKLYQVALDKKIISPTYNFKKYVYELFKQNEVRCYKKGYNKSQAVCDTAEDVKKSEAYVYSVIDLMES